MLPLIGLFAPYLVGYAIGWCLIDFHYKYSKKSKWLITILKAVVGCIVMVVVVLLFRMTGESTAKTNLKYFGDVDYAFKLMESYADAYTPESTANRYTYLLQANRELAARQTTGQLFTYVCGSANYQKFMALKPVRPPVSDTVYEMSTTPDDPDWKAITQLIAGEVRSNILEQKRSGG